MFQISDKYEATAGFIFLMIFILWKFFKIGHIISNQIDVYLKLASNKLLRWVLKRRREKEECTSCHFQYDHKDNKKSLKDHPLMNIRNLDMLYILAKDISEQIDKKQPGKQLLVALGQSPVYLLEMIKLIDSYKDRNDRTYTNVAFSGMAFGPIKATEEYDQIINIKEYKGICDIYKKYLKKLGLSPENISNLKQENTQLIILEVCRWGSGLDSFLSFFEDKTFFSVYLQSADVKKACYGNPPAFMSKSLKIPLSGARDKLIIDLANTDPFNDRMVPHFHYCRWKLVDPLKFKPSQNVELILKKMKRYVHDKRKNEYPKR